MGLTFKLLNPEDVIRVLEGEEKESEGEGDGEREGGGGRRRGGERG